MKKLMVLIVTLLVMPVAWSESGVVDIFNYPVSQATCDTKAGPFLGFKKKAGYRLGEHWSHKDGSSAAGEPVFAIANGTVVDVVESGESDLGIVVVIEHWLLDNSLVYSVYGNLTPTVIVDEEVVGGEQIGQVAGSYLYFSVQMRPWHLGDKRYLKQIMLGTIGDYLAPSNFIDQRCGEYVKLFARGWNLGIEVPVDASVWLASCQYGGGTADLGMAVDNGWLEQLGHLIDPGGQPWDIYLDSISGFTDNLQYEVKALKDGVTLHIYQPAYGHLDQMALINLIEVAWNYHETPDHQIVIGTAKPKTFKSANSVADPGYKAYQMKFKTGEIVRDTWGKQVIFYWECSTANPFDRQVKMAKSDGSPITPWFNISQNPVDKK